MKYPLSLRFKHFTIASQIVVADADDNIVFYVKQKAFKFKESVTIFADTQQRVPLYTITADRVLDFSANYQLADCEGVIIGNVARQGMRSLWNASYTVSADNRPECTIREENPWIKMADALIGLIPYAELLLGYVFHPAYIVQQDPDMPLMRLRKVPSFLESKFSIEKLATLDATEEQRLLLSLLMVVLLERSRG